MEKLIYTQGHPKVYTPRNMKDRQAGAQSGVAVNSLAPLAQVVELAAPISRQATTIPLLSL